MNDKESVERVHQICRDTLWEVLEFDILPILENYADEAEAMAVKLKGSIVELSKAGHGSRKNWDPLKIRWERSEGPKGEYERSEDFNNLEFKIMLKDLAFHDGKLTRDGYFYWVFRNGSTVGRKRRG